MKNMFKLGAIIIALFSMVSANYAASVYDVANIKVNETAPDGIQAKQKGLAVAEQKAVAVLFKRLLPAKEKDRALSRLDKETRSLLVKGYSVKNEQSGGNQYVAEITIKFRETAVKRYFANIGASFSDAQADTTIFLPILTNEAGESVIWSGENAWADAFATKDLENSLIPLKIPTKSEAALLATEEEVLAVDENALYQLATIAPEASEFIFAQVILGNGVAKLQVSGAFKMNKTYSTKGGDMKAVYNMMANDFLDRLAKGQRSNNIENVPVYNKIKALVVFRDLDQWLDLRGKLTNITSIKEVETDAMSATGAFVNISYQGAIEELAGELDFVGLSLYDLGTYYEIRG